jgi:hypothetical protein
MKQEITIRNAVDENGNPAGGIAIGNGIKIQWQDGPLQTAAAREEPNGAFVEDIIAIAIARLNFYQNSKFWRKENSDALHCLWKALEHLDSRTKRREEAGVEGTCEATPEEGQKQVMPEAEPLLAPEPPAQEQVAE